MYKYQFVHHRTIKLPFWCRMIVLVDSVVKLQRISSQIVPPFWFPAKCSEQERKATREADVRIGDASLLSDNCVKRAEAAKQPIIKRKREIWSRHKLWLPAACREAAPKAVRLQIRDVINSERTSA